MVGKENRVTGSAVTGSAVTAPVVALPADAPDWLLEAVQQGGGVPGPLEDADVLVHFGRVTAMPHIPDAVRWVQLPGAGIEAYLSAGVIDDRRVWTSAAGAYAGTVAEHAVALLLAGVRGLVAAAHQSSWRPDLVSSRASGLAGSTVTIVGAGGIGRRAIELLVPFGATVIAVNRSGREVPGAARTVPVADIDGIWSDTEHVIIAAPATDETRGLVNDEVLRRLRPTSWIVNIARGSLVDTDALIAAITDGRIAGAALDVTDPEPLPDGHPLWSTPGVLITPHTANPRQHYRAALAERVRENVSRFAAGQELLGVVDLAAGY